MDIKQTAKLNIPKTSVDSNIISEDIAALALSLRDQLHFFSGKTFLVTGAGGFLGKYIVLLFKYLNDHLLNDKVSAILLDNFITGYEHQVLSDKYLVFKKHNVIEPFQSERQ